MLEKDQNELTDLESLLIGLASVLGNVYGIDETQNAFKSLADDPKFWEIRKTIDSMGDRELLETVLKNNPDEERLRFKLIENKKEE